MQSEGGGDEPKDREAPRLSRRSLLAGAGACASCAIGGFWGARLLVPGVAAAGATNHTGTLQQRELAQPRAIAHIQTDQPVVGLTFDDGPDPKYTPTVLDELAKRGMTATFFLVGVNAIARTALVDRQIAEGHQIGNHTWDHRILDLLPDDQVLSEIERGSAALVAAGAPKPTLFRPPKGYTDSDVKVLAGAEDYRTVFWEACIEHELVVHREIRDAVGAMLQRVRPGSIVLAHDGGHILAAGHPYLDRTTTMEALPLLLDGLAARGLRGVSVGELLRLAAPRQRTS